MLLHTTCRYARGVWNMYAVLLARNQSLHPASAALMLDTQTLNRKNLCDYHVMMTSSFQEHLLVLEIVLLTHVPHYSSASRPATSLCSHKSTTSGLPYHGYSANAQCSDHGGCSLALDREGQSRAGT